MSHTYGQTKFHGHNQEGSFQSGRHTLVKIWTCHEVDATGVISSRQELVDDGIIAVVNVATNNITIQDVVYATNAAYDQAYAAQTNLDNLIAAFSVFAQPVSVRVTDGIVQSGASNTTPRLGTFTQLVAGADLLGSDMTQAAGLVWVVEFIFEQKGILTNAAGSAGFVRGEPSIGATGDNFGDANAAYHLLLQGTVQYVTGDLAQGGDSENMDDADTGVETGAGFADTGQLSVGLISLAEDAYAGAVGNQVFMVSNTDSDEDTSQTFLVEEFNMPDLQS